MRDFIVTIAAVFVHYSLKILSFGKYHPTRIVFFSYFGKQYSCNPKYISEYIVSNGLPFEIVWAFIEPEKHRDLEENGVTLVKYNSLRFIHMCLRSGYIITNSETPAWLPILSRQTLINTWHGGGAYKKVGNAHAKETAGERMRANFARRNPCIYISSSKCFTELTLRESFHHKGKIFSSGMPRNDLFFNRNADYLQKKVRTYYHIDSDVRLLLFAPTYPEFGDDPLEGLSFSALKKTLSEAFNGKWIILLRTHYFVNNTNHAEKDFIDVSDYPDMQELLYVSDILMTNYSSSIWDFSFTKRPCFLYAPDLKKYNIQRGFYSDINTWPYPLSVSFEELTDNILSFDSSEYANNVDAHHNALGNFECGHATKAIVDYLAESANISPKSIESGR